MTFEESIKRCIELLKEHHQSRSAEEQALEEDLNKAAIKQLEHKLKTDSWRGYE